MSNVIAKSLLLALFMATTTIANAQECFCLSHPDGAILRGCEAKGATFLCTDPETLKKSVQKVSSDWKRIEAGTDRCIVCRPAARGTAGEVPRGDEDAKKQQ
jgi:hypothetical protein